MFLHPYAIEQNYTPSKLTNTVWIFGIIKSYHAPWTGVASCLKKFENKWIMTHWYFCWFIKKCCLRDVVHPFPTSPWPRLPSPTPGPCHFKIYYGEKLLPIGGQGHRPSGLAVGMYALDHSLWDDASKRKITETVRDAQSGGRRLQPNLLLWISLLSLLTKSSRRWGGGEDEKNEKLNGYQRTPGCVMTGGVTREERTSQAKSAQRKVESKKLMRRWVQFLCLGLYVGQWEETKPISGDKLVRIYFYRLRCEGLSHWRAPDASRGSETRRDTERSIRTLALPFDSFGSLQCQQREQRVGTTKVSSFIAYSTAWTFDHFSSVIGRSVKVPHAG